MTPETFENLGLGSVLILLTLGLWEVAKYLRTS